MGGSTDGLASSPPGRRLVQNKYGEAEAFYREAISTAEKTLSNHPSHSTMISNLAGLLREQVGAEFQYSRYRRGVHVHREMCRPGLLG